MEMWPNHLPFPRCRLGLPHVGSSSSEEGLHKNVKSISISRTKLQVVLDSLSCSSIENGDEGGKLGTNWMGRTAKQVQTKVLCERKICKSESFCFKVDKGKIRTCSMYNWKRAERKEKASIYYRWHSLLIISTKHHILDKIFLEEAMFTRVRWVDWREVQTQYPGIPRIFNLGFVHIVHKAWMSDFKENQVCRVGVSRCVAFVTDMLVLMTRPCQKAGGRWNTKMAVGESLSSR